MALWTPADTTTAIWFDGSDSSTIGIGSGAVERWDDKSGNARHAEQLTISSRPVVAAAELNGLDVLTFSSDYLQTANVSIHSGLWTAFAVAKSTATTGVGSIVDQDRSAAEPIARLGQYLRRNTTNVESLAFNTVPTAFTATRTGTVTNWAVWGGVRESAAITAYYDGRAGTPVTITGTAPTGTVPISIGARDNGSTLTQYWVGDIAEIILVSGALAEADRERFEGYLAWKWGLEGGLEAGHPYKSAAPVTGPTITNVPNMTRGIQATITGTGFGT